MVTLLELYSFIKTLNKAEKRFFKLLLATESSNVEKQLKLFDFLEKRKNTDELEMKIKKESRSILSVENINHLYNLVLSSQRNFYSDNIRGFTLTDEVNNLKILFEKAQYKQCRKMLKSAKDRAIDIEKFGVLMQLVEIEKQLLSHEILDDSYLRLYEYLEEEHKRYSDLEKNLSSFFILYAQIQNKIKNGNTAEDLFFKSVLSSETLKHPTQACCKKSQFLFYQCRALAWLALHDAANASTEIEKAKQLMTQHSLIASEMPRHYIDVLFHSARLELICNQPSIVPSLKSLEMLLAANEMPAVDLNLKLRSYVFLIRLQMNYNGRSISETETIAKEILQFITQYETVINREDTTQLLFALTNYYIYTLAFFEARETHAMLRKYTDRNNQADLKNYSLLQEYVIATETGNTAQINLIRPSLQRLVQSGFFRKDETEVIHVLLNLPDDKDAETTITEIIKHHHTRMNPDTFRDKLDLSYLNCINYLISKAGKDFAIATVFNSSSTTLSETNI